jgi:N-acetylneuraminate synthase
MKTKIIADIGSNHDGKIERAFNLIEIAKHCGADYAKFQFYKADNLINEKAFENMKIGHQSSWKQSVYETFKLFETPYDWIPELANYCKKIKIEFLGTPYDLQAVELLDNYVNSYKIGSGDLNYTDLLIAVAKKMKKIFLGTGASTWKEIRAAKEIIKQYNKDIVLMQCNTNYTGKKKNIEYINLNAIKKEGMLGFSDHTKSIAVIIGAIASGVQYIERHITDGKSSSPDNKYAMLPKEFETIINEIRDYEKALGNGVKMIEENENETEKIQQRAWYARIDLKSNDVLTAQNIIALRPYDEKGIKPCFSICGKKIKKDINAFDLITWGNID